MAQTIMRYQIADYLNTGTTETPSYALMGVGFNTLDESPAAQLDSKTYINQTAQSSIIKSYQPSFPFDTDLVGDEDAVMAIYHVGRNQKTGADAELEYVRVELFDDTNAATNDYPARKFTVAVQVDSISGSGGEAMKASGNLMAVGDFVDGSFNTSTRTFTASA